MDVPDDSQEGTVEIGLEEYVARSASLLTDASSSLQSIAEVETRRAKLRETLESSRDDWTQLQSAGGVSQRSSNTFVARMHDAVRDLQTLNALTVDLAEQSYDSYDRAIDEIDHRIRLLQSCTRPSSDAPAVVPNPSRHHGKCLRPRTPKNHALEPRYCFCDGVAYGDMIRCDNDDCPIEWFHFGCLEPGGAFVPPAGRWLCPQCKRA